MTIVETTCSVTGGVDTHAEVHVAAVVDHVGGVLGIETFATTEAGCQQLIDWLRTHGDVDLVGVEGTGSYGAGLTGSWNGPGSRWSRSTDRTGKCGAGRASPTRSTPSSPPERHCRVKRSGSPKSRNGDVEAIRVLMIARRSAASERIAALCQLRHLCFTADHQVRRRFEGPLGGPADRPGRRAATPPQRHGALLHAAGHAHPRPPGCLPRRRARQPRHGRSARSSSAAAPGCWRCTASATTSPPSCSSPPATTPTGSAPRPRSPTSAASPRSRRPRARPAGTDSTGAATARPTTPSTAS